MTWWKAIRRIIRWSLPVNLLLAGAAYACLHHPVMQVRTLEASYVDGCAVDSIFQQRIADLVFVRGDSNLLHIDTEGIADSVLSWDSDLLRVDVGLRPPHTVCVRIERSQPLAWWATPRLQAVDYRGQVLKSDSFAECSSLPILSPTDFLEKNLDRMHSIDLYQQLLRHDQRWGQVISQIGCNADSGWYLILSADAEKVLLGWEITQAKLDRLARFLESTPIQHWQGAHIDVRFSERVIVTPSG